MIIALKTSSGKVFKEEILANDLTLEDAKERFDSPLCTVVGVEQKKEGKLSNFEACRIIANEGADYAVRHYISADEFIDPKTRQLWRAAENALDALETYIDFDAYDE
jgi:hypothetical protein